MQGEFRTLKESLEAEKQLVLEVGSLRPCIVHPACVPTTIRAVVARLFPALPCPALPCPALPLPPLPVTLRLLRQFWRQRNDGR